MYPAYPFLALNGAISLHIILTYLGSTKRTVIGRIPVKVKLVAVVSLVIVAIDAGLLRILGMVTAYNAPLKIFEPLEQQGAKGDSICLGKEWYRFPSSFFLPNDMRAKFISSEFRGLLPGEFPEATMGYLSRVESASLIPPGMNDRNEEDSGKYVSPVPFFLLKTCS